ncbi:Protein C08F8.6 [Aphelenchoides avenae]|nr:Protein C08F8.6 [Aphelenchus avenae]
MIVEFTKGSLPWRNKTEIDEIGRWKKSCRQKLQMKQLLGGCPREYIDILKAIDTGGFFATPDYPACYRLLRQAIRATGASEFPYDWERWEEERKQREEKEKQGKEGEKRKKEKDGEKQKDSDKQKKDDDKTAKADSEMQKDKEKEEPPKK